MTPITTIYTPDDVIRLVGNTHMDYSQYDSVEELLRLMEFPDADRGLLALAVMADGRVFYHYAASSDMNFNFDLLSSVGEPWISTFEAIIAEHKLDIRTFEVGRAPWIYHALADHAAEGAVMTGPA